MSCVRQLPVIETLAEEFNGRASFVKVDTSEDDTTLAAFDSSSYPTYIVYRDGIEVDRLTINFAPWFIEERLRRMVDNAIDTR